MFTLKSFLLLNTSLLPLVLWKLELLKNVVVKIKFIIVVIETNIFGDFIMKKRC